MEGQPYIIAHRGASIYAPENTLAAIQKAVDARADGVEFDVQLASDGVPVVIHDPTLDRTGSIRGDVSELSSSELGRIDVGSWFNIKYPKLSNPIYARQKIPTLGQVLELLVNFDGLIYIELKTSQKNNRDLVKAVCGVLRGSPLLPQVILKSFDLTVIPEIKQLLPTVQTAALFGLTIFNLLRSRKHLVSIVRDLNADQISLHHSLITNDLISLTDPPRIPVTVWTTDDPNWVIRCRKLGVRALITNDPARLMKYRDNYS